MFGGGIFMMSPLFFARIGRVLLDVFSIKKSKISAGVVIAIMIASSKELGGSKLGDVIGDSLLDQSCFAIG